VIPLVAGAAVRTLGTDGWWLHRLTLDAATDHQPQL